MTSVQTGISINDSNVRMIDPKSLKKVNLTEASNEIFQRLYDGQQKYLQSRYTSIADTSNHPAYQDYATVRVNGKVVARLDNNGFAETSNALGSKLMGELPGSVNGKSGPMLAQARAEKIAELVGGKVERSSTTLTQGQYDALAKPESTLDMAAMKADPMYEQLQKWKQARTEFLAQQIAQGDGETGETAPAGDAANKFLDYMSKSPEERYMEAFLAKKGLTQEQFEQLPPDQRASLLQEFAKEFKDQALESVAESIERSA